MNLNKLRIIIFIEAWEPYVGGGQMHTKQLIHRLIKDYGFNVTLISRKLIIDGNKSLGPAGPRGLMMCFLHSMQNP